MTSWSGYRPAWAVGSWPACEVLGRIEAMPEMYGVVWQDVRAARLRKFRHVVYYVAFADRVEVLAVLHGSRDASAWKSRA